MENKLSLDSDKNKKLEQLLTLLNHYLLAGRSDDALSALKKMETFLKETGNERIIQSFTAKALATQKKYDEALEYLKEQDEDIHSIKLKATILYAQALETSDWKAILNYLNYAYKKTRDVGLLLELCEIKCELHDWAFVAKYAKELINKIPTAEIINMTAISAFNAKKYELCLSILDNNINLFPNKKLPQKLKRIRVSAEMNLGLLPKAIEEAEFLASEEPTIENLLFLAQAYYEAGDFKNIIPVAKKIYKDPSATSSELLSIAKSIKLEDPEFAILLWRKAVTEKLEAGLVTAALSLGYELGLDKELQPLFDRLPELTERDIAQGGIKMLTLNEIKEHLIESRDILTANLESYSKGLVPIHLLVPRAKFTLAELYHTQRERCETLDPSHRGFSLPARYGGRALPPDFPEITQKHRLNLDVTALLLAEHIGILEIVEKAFKPLRISSKLTTALASMKNDLVFHQPSRLRDYQHIIDLYNKGGLLTYDSESIDISSSEEILNIELGIDWLRNYYFANREGGYLIDSLPITAISTFEELTLYPINFNKVVASPLELVKQLKEYGPLSDEAFKRTVKALTGNNLNIDIDAKVVLGGKIYLEKGIAESLSNAEILDDVCKKFKTYISKSDLNDCIETLKWQQERTATLNWLNALLDRVNIGLSTGVYEAIPFKLPKSKKKEEFKNEPEAQALITLMNLKTDKKYGDLIWIDDRFVNSFNYMNTIPVIGINEILKILVSLKHISEDAYYNYLYRLRAANVRYIPLESGEIIHYLQKATHKDDSGIRINNTKELLALRRYIPGCLLEGKNLQIPPLAPGSPNANGEMAFLFGLSHALNDTIISIWQDEKDDEAINVYSNWILFNLYIDHVGLFNSVQSDKLENDNKHLTGVSIASLLSRGIQLGEKRKAYFHWLEQNILEQRLQTEPSLLFLISDVMKKSLSGVIDNAESSEKINYLTLAQSFFKDLPKAIADELAKDLAFSEMLKIQTEQVTAFDDLVFLAEPFWLEIEKTANGSPVTLETKNKKYSIEFVPDKEGGLLYTHPITNEKKCFVIEELPILSNDNEAISDFIDSKARMLDCSPGEIALLKERLITLQGKQRLEEYVRYFKVSLSVYYRDLFNNLTSGVSFDFYQLEHPQLEGLFRYLALPPYHAFNDVPCDADSIFLSIFEQFGYEEAFLRISGFPIPISNKAIENFRALPFLEQKDTFKQLLTLQHSPISWMHLLKLAADAGSSQKLFSRFVRIQLKRLVTTPFIDHIDAFISVLKWLDSDLFETVSVGEYPDSAKLSLIWMHAHRLYGIFSKARVPSNFISSVFGRMSRQTKSSLFVEDSMYRQDVSHPDNLDKTSFLFVGLFYIVSDSDNHLVDENILVRTTELSKKSVNNIDIPSFALLRDSCRAMNKLSSILYGSMEDKLKDILPDADFNNFTLGSVHTLVHSSIEKLREANYNYPSWEFLHTVFGTFPPYDNLRDDLVTAITSYKFNPLLDISINNASFAMRTASLLFIHLNDEKLKKHLLSEIQELGMQLATMEPLNSGFHINYQASVFDTQYLHLLDAIVNIAKASPENTIEEFKEAVTSLLNVWPSKRSITLSVLMDFIYTLPIEEAKQFWPLVFYTRILPDT